MERPNRHIPMEIVEEILLNLPVKSLLRFSSVSKSWNSMISDSGFVKRFRGRASVPGRETILLKAYYGGYLRNAMISSLSSISLHNPIRHERPLVLPFNVKTRILASCNELWCVEALNELCLLNPSMRTYRILPHPSLQSWPGTIFSKISYGLGYDSVGDDYKILIIGWDPHVTVWRGMLCVYNVYRNYTRFVMWVMEDYGGDKLWTKELDISYGQIIGQCYSPPFKPLYFYENSQNVIKELSCAADEKVILMCEEYDSNLVVKMGGSTFYRSCQIHSSFIYVESLVSPDIWPTSAAPTY